MGAGSRVTGQMGCAPGLRSILIGAVTAIEELARPDRYPRSSRYDPAWLLDLDMGPNPLWLLEDLARDLDLRPGMQVLDLGSGKGATSVFLAREYGVQVVAADWWIAADEAAAVFASAGVASRVTAVRAEAHALPFGKGSFDAIVSIDAFEYFGTADSYLPYLAGFLRPGGQLGVATPGMTREIRELGAIPAHIKAAVRLGADRLAHRRVVAFPVGDHRAGDGDLGTTAARRVAGLAAVDAGGGRARRAGSPTQSPGGDRPAHR